MKNFINCSCLNKKLQEENLIIVDCRFDLGNDNYGLNSYNKGHIMNAFFMDMNKDLAGPKAEHGGRHPLPDIEVFVKKIESFGIDSKSIIVAYDDGDLCGASRFWWIMKYLGHEKIYVLEGGINSWVKEGYALNQEVPKCESNNYEYSINSSILASMEDVAALSTNNKGTIIDSRSYERFTGEVEPIDVKGGHIRNACNLFWMDVFSEDKLKNKEELKNHFSKVIKDSPIVVHCGSGITGAVNYIVLDELDLDCKLYVGSWSDWISYEENEIITGA